VEKVMKIDKNVPIPARMPRNKTAFVKDMEVGDSVLFRGGFQGVEAKRVIGALRRYGYRCVSRIVPGTGHGDDADVRVWRVEGSPKTRGPHRPGKKGKVTRSTRAGKKGKVIACPECGHYSVVYHFSWAATECGGCKRNIGKTDHLLPKLSKRKEAKIREACDSDNKVRQFCATKLRPLWKNSDQDVYSTAFDALYNFLNKHDLSSQLGEVSDETIEELAKDPSFWDILKSRFSPEEQAAICVENKDD
jgi:ribosomal protein S27E